jgi:hypothetical protein
MSQWKTVPNFFPDPDDLSNETWYHLHEGYGVAGYEVKRSGRYYKKIKVDGSFGNLILFLGFSDWWKRWRPRRSLFGYLLGTWDKI